MERPTCQTCPYWDSDSPHLHAEDVWPCRRNPPALVTTDYIKVAIENEWDDASPCAGAWPMTRGTDWCGEHPQFQVYLAGTEDFPGDDD